MEEDKAPVDSEAKKKIKLGIIIPIIVAIVFVGVFVYLDYRDKPVEEPNGNQQTEPYFPKPVSPSQNPRRTEQLSPTLGCAGPVNIKPEILKEYDKEWVISNNGQTRTISLGKYRIIAPINLVFDIPKLWLYFFSEDLSDREDFLYAIEESYTSRIVLRVNDFEREISLGGSEYMFIELSDYPLGDLYPYDREAFIDFEFFVDLTCKNLENGVCLDNKGKALDYINGLDIKSQIRIFAVGCQEFTNDLGTSANFKYGD